MYASRLKLLLCLAALALVAGSGSIAHAGWIEANDVPSVAELRLDVAASGPLAPWLNDSPGDPDALAPVSGVGSPRVETVRNTTFACSAVTKSALLVDDRNNGTVRAESPAAPGSGIWEDVFRPPRNSIF